MNQQTVWITSITLKDVDNLEEVFAYLTDIGWIIPMWLIELRGRVVLTNKVPNLIIDSYIETSGKDHE
jgi:hypothetical protein